MATGDRVQFVCKYCGQTRPMKPSAAAYQDYCSKSCASKAMWETRERAEKPVPRERLRCSVEGCHKEPRGSNGYCKQHYTRWCRSGDPLVLKRAAGSCEPGCTCNRHNAKRGVRVPSAPCQSCGAVTMVHPCYGPGGNQQRKFCGQACWRQWQADQATARQAAGDTKRWDMSEAEFRSRLKSQGGRCPICSKELRGRDIHRDHCHTTGGWRGLLCASCNKGLGLFGDDPERLMAAAFYLAKEVNILGDLACQP